MVACQECGTNSPLDSKFCKHCGTELSEEARLVAADRVKQMLEEGNALFTEGRVDEALMVSEAAVSADPSNALAFSLKGLCLERLGNLADALAAYEQAATLNPAGTLDKIKVQSLRQRLTASALTSEAAAAVPDRRRAFAMAGSAVLLVAGCGVLLAAAMGSKPERVAKNDPTPVSQIQGFPVTQTKTDDSTVQPQTKPAVEPPAPGTSDGGGIKLPPVPNGVLPGSTLDSGETPAGPIVVGRDPGENQPNNPQVPIDRDPGPVLVPSNNPNPQPPAPQPEDKGFIDIQVAPRGGGRPNQPGAQPISSGPSSTAAVDANGVEALRRVAQNEFELGRYQQAAGSYEKVANSGGNSGKVQQRLGQCYEKLGNTSAAAKSYNLAVVLYQNEIKAGRNVDANRAGLNASMQALKVVGGG